MKDAEEALLAACDAVELALVGTPGTIVIVPASESLRLARAIDHWRAAKAEGFVSARAQEIAELRANNEALVAQVAIFETRVRDLRETLQRAERECEAYLEALRKLRSGD